jgi:hypothetical protein
MGVDTGGGQGTRAVGRVVAAGLALAFAFGLTGCFWSGGGGEQHDDRQERMDAIAAEVQATLAGRTDVAQVTVNYIDDISDSGFVDASIQVKSGTPFTPVEGEAVRLLWQSKLEPLKTIRIALVDAVDVSRNEVLHFDAVGKDKAALEAKYGRRPG